MTDQNNAALEWIDSGPFYKTAATPDGQFIPVDSEAEKLRVQRAYECGFAAALASREAPPTAQEPKQCLVCSGKSFAKIDGEQMRWRCVECKTVTPPPACQQEAVTVAEAAQVLLDSLMRSSPDAEGAAAWHRAWTAMDDQTGYAWNKFAAALRALKGGSDNE